VLWKDGSLVDRFYLLVQGVCQTETKEGVQTLLPGAIVGFSEFKSTAPTALSVKAASECSVIEWRRDIFQDFMQGVPELKKAWQTISPLDYENFLENLFD
jgi:CRP-like cAMP-binding protein